MNKVTVEKEIDGEKKRYDIEVSEDNTAYLTYGETVVSNDGNAKIHYPSNKNQIKECLKTIVIVSAITILLIAAYHLLNQPPIVLVK